MDGSLQELWLWDPLDLTARKLIGLMMVLSARPTASRAAMICVAALFADPAIYIGSSTYVWLWFEEAG